MKILLSLIICSQVHTTCMPPYEWPETFNTTYDCMMFGYEESMNKMREIGRVESNKHGIYIRFTCTPEETICQCGRIMVRRDNFSPLPTLTFIPL